MSDLLRRLQGLGCTEAKHWDLFRVKAREKAAFPFDGHTSQDVLDRLRAMLEVK